MKFVQFETWWAEKKWSEFDFEVFRVLGRGGFGLVNGCRCMRTGKIYAMKTMDKRRVKTNQGEQMCINEMVLLNKCSSKFVLDLKYAFTNEFELFIIMDVKAGGDLNFHLHEKKKFNKLETQYYIARTCEGLQAIHDAGWVYRDLKPENLLLANDGRCSISDLGLACPWKEGLAGVAGTPGYWPPEMLEKQRYDKLVDFWTLGVVFVEFLTGTCPFRSSQALKYGKEKGHKDKLLMVNEAITSMEVEYDTSVMDANAIDLAKALLQKNPADRLGKNGISDIRNHKYFEGFDWAGVEDDTFSPPFVPPDSVNAANQDEIGKFANDDEIKGVELKEKDHKKYETFYAANKRAFEIDVVGFLEWENKQPKPKGSPAAESKACVVS